MFTSPILLLSANRWDFVDEKTGENRTGTTVHVVNMTSQQNTNEMVGNKPTKFTLDYSFIEKIRDLKLPCFATGNFEMNFNNNKLQLVDFTDTKEFVANGTK